MSVISCVKDRNANHSPDEKEQSQNINSNDILKNKIDTMTYSKRAKGNKLIPLNQYGIKPMREGGEEIDDYLAEHFIYQAKNGVLKNITTVDYKQYFDTYEVPVSILKELRDNNISNSVGLELRFVELKDNYGKITKQTNSPNYLYLIAIPVKKDTKPASENRNYIIFNLINNSFKLSDNILTDEEYDKLEYDYHNNSPMYKALTKYYSHYGMGNTKAIYYSWDDISDNIIEYARIKNYEYVKFRLAEIINFNSIMFRVGRITEDSIIVQKYEEAYKDREKQLTIIGEFYRTKILGKSSYYFDMGDLRP